MAGKNKLSVCVLSSSYPRTANGEESIFIKRLVEGFANYSIGGVVITAFDETGDLKENQGIFTVYRVKYGLLISGRLASGDGIMPRLKKYPWLILQTPMLILMLAHKTWSLRTKYDLVQANWLPIGAAALIAKWISGKPYTLTVRGSDMKLAQLKVFNLFFRLILRQASHVISVNKSFLPTIQKLGKLDSSRLHYIPNGVFFEEPTEAFKEEICSKFQLNSSDKYLIHVGRVIPLKKIEFLIDLLANPALKDYKLLVVGRAVDTDYLGSLMARAQSHEIENRVRFLGPVSPQYIPALLKLSAAYLSFSSHEGRPNSMLEAMAAGLPVIASSIDGHKEIIANEKNGFLFPYTEPEKVIKTILLLEDKHELREQISARAKSAISSYTWSATAKKYQELFNSMTA